MTVFVTGATGHLGANLVRLLLERGERVRVLVRKGSDHAAIAGLPVEHVFGDLRDEARLEAAMEGCDRVHHLAAMVSLRGRDREALYETNVLGTRRVLAAAARVGVAKVVHCSSFEAVGRDSRGWSDASQIPSPFESALDYERSKVFAEMEVFRAAARGLDVCIVNPSGMVGPWDFKPSLIGRTIIDFVRGRLPIYLRGAYDFVSVEDVALGHVLAMERGARGERYLLCGELTALSDVLRWVEALLDIRRVRVGLSPRWIQPFVRIKDEVEERLWPSHHPRFNAQTIALLASNKRGDVQPTERALGWRARPPREAFEAQVRWFIEHGMLNR